MLDRAVERHGLRLRAMHEPLHPQTGKPVSLILVGSWPIKLAP